MSLLFQFFACAVLTCVQPLPLAVIDRLRRRGPVGENQEYRQKNVHKFKKKTKKSNHLKTIANNTHFPKPNKTLIYFQLFQVTLKVHRMPRSHITADHTDLGGDCKPWQREGKTDFFFFSPLGKIRNIMML